MDTLRVDKSEPFCWALLSEGTAENPECCQTNRVCDSPEDAESGDLDDDRNNWSNTGKCRLLWGRICPGVDLEHRIVRTSHRSCRHKLRAEFALHGYRVEPCSEIVFCILDMCLEPLADFAHVELGSCGVHRTLPLLDLAPVESLV